MSECPFMQDCRQTKDKVQALEVSHATTAAQVEAVAGCASRIEQSVEKALEAFKDTTKDLYSKYGAVKEQVHAEETGRMRADQNIEDKITACDKEIEKKIVEGDKGLELKIESIEDKKGNRTGKIITWTFSAAALIVSLLAIFYR